MASPRFRRRKEDRPAEITEAAMAVFAEKGFAAARVEEVAQRAGVSKGLLYLYFRTKEELFKAVIKSFVAPRIDALGADFDHSDLSAEAYLRGPFLDLATSIPKSPVRVMVRLIIAEGPKHPDLIEYYWDHVVSHGIAALRKIVARGVSNGEFRRSALDEFPQLLVTPVLFACIWTSVFSKQQPLDTDALIRAHIELLLSAIRQEGGAK